jgi:hypothetical protein
MGKADRCATPTGADADERELPNNDCPPCPPRRPCREIPVAKNLALDPDPSREARRWRYNENCTLSRGIECALSLPRDLPVASKHCAPTLPVPGALPRAAGIGVERRVDTRRSQNLEQVPRCYQIGLAGGRVGFQPIDEWQLKITKRATEVTRAFAWPITFVGVRRTRFWLCFLVVKLCAQRTLRLKLTTSVASHLPPTA